MRVSASVAHYRSVLLTSKTPSARQVSAGTEEPWVFPMCAVQRNPRCFLAVLIPSHTDTCLLVCSPGYDC